LAQSSKRDMIFVSHANPEENEFARWIALQLANEGYPVWCDQTKLLGGETFWEDIQDAIKNRTVKFVFALSRASNEKPGTLDELDCALGTEKKHLLKDFIIPLKMDDLPYDDTYIGMRRLNQIDFRSSWARGLSILLEKLQKDNVPKNRQFNPAAVSSWWRSQREFSANQGIVEERDEHLSNWFPIQGIPRIINRHVVSRKGIGKIDFDTEGFPYPAVRDTDLSFLSFAKKDDFQRSLPQNHFIEATFTNCTIDSIVSRTGPRGYPAHLTRILRDAWERAMARTGLSVYELSNQAKCYYFIFGTVADNRLFFQGVNGKRDRRDVIGYSTRLGRKRYWHYGVNAKPVLYPQPHLVLKGHVLFSSDGLKVWDNKEKIAKARRKQCRSWWNDEWRDRILAVMAHISNEQGEIRIPVASDVSLHVASWPEVFESTVSYGDPVDFVKEEELDDYDFEETEQDEEDEESEETKK
jgi:TIR domain